MPVPPVTEFTGQLPAENDPATFPARAEALFDWLVGQGMPTFNAAIAAVNLALNDNGTVLDTAGAAIALTTNANTIRETGGTGNAYTISPAVAVAAYADGQTFMLRPNRQNSGAVTLAVGGLAATPVRKIAASGSGFVELAAGDWRQGEIHIVTFRSAQFELLTVPLNGFVRTDQAHTITGPWTFNGALGFGNPAQVRLALDLNFTVTPYARALLDDATADQARVTLGAVPFFRGVNTGTGLSGGGSLEVDRTIFVANGGIGTAQLAANERMTTANVLAVTAGAAADAIGSYALLRFNGASDLPPGTTVFGSGLTWISAQGIGVGSPSGTWRLMGYVGTDTNADRTSLFLRIA